MTKRQPQGLTEWKIGNTSAFLRVIGEAKTVHSRRGEEAHK